MDWQILMDYRETDKDKDVPTIPIDEQPLIIGLQAFGIPPLYAETDGSKICVHFEKEKASEAYRKIQLALSPTSTEPLLIDFRKEILAQQAWRNLITMMRNVKSPRRKFSD